MQKCIGCGKFVEPMDGHCPNCYSNVNTGLIVPIGEIEENIEEIYEELWKLRFQVRDLKSQLNLKHHVETKAIGQEMD